MKYWWHTDRRKILTVKWLDPIPVASLIAVGVTLLLLSLWPWYG